MPGQEKVIVSLTSFPAAVHYAADAVRSILEGSVLPDKVVLYLTVSQFPDSTIPRELVDLSAANPVFEVRNYDDEIRSYRKLIPALRDFPDAVIVTVDDDVWYHRHMLRDLLRLHGKLPKNVLAHRAKRMKIDAPYKKWKKYRWYSFLLKRLHFSFSNMQTGVGGVLYPPGALKADMVAGNEFGELAPTTDDIWFWAAAAANGVRTVPVPFGRNKPRGLKKPKELSLKTVNFKAGTDRNRAALDKILERYPEIRRRIESEK